MSARRNKTMKDGRGGKTSQRSHMHSSSLEEVDLDSGSNFPHVPMHISHTDVREDAEDPNDKTPRSSLAGDRYNIALLLFLYVLQGIPLGLGGSIPLLLSSRKVSYAQQSIFSFVFWPFSLKLLWAPIVDSAYFPAFGRRKTWLIPTQYLIGVFMMVLSYYTPWLMGELGGEVNIYLLTGLFFMLNFLAATQDIAVDGWALTMLSRRNVGWASTCNSIGQTAGFFLGNVVFMALESADFCNKWLRSESAAQVTGIVTLSSFLFLWGIIFFVATTLVMLLKRETDGENGGEEEDHEGIVDTYCLLWKIVNLRSIKSLIAILLTVKIGFAAADAITGLKLVEQGVPKANLAMLAVPLVPIQILLPLIISKYTSGPRPMSLFLKAMPYRLCMGVVFAGIVWWAPSTMTEDGVYPLYFYGAVLVAYALHQVALYCMFVAIMGFHAKISDPKIGGSYMTLLNTFANLGGNWPSTVVLWMMEALTTHACEGATEAMGADLTCGTKEATLACEAAKGSCTTIRDGYYVLSAVCFVIGVLWLWFKSRRVRELERLPASAWTCSADDK